MDRPLLKFAQPSISEDEINEVVECLRSGWWTTGPRCRRFEQEFANFVGAKHALAVNSATAGLHLALEAIGVEPQDKVVTTPYTFTATAEVVRYLGADPLFVDIDPVTFNIDSNAVETALRRNNDIKAILPVHFAGQACAMDDIIESARKHGVRVVEDAAHALPTTHHGRMVGSIGDITAFSFYVTKTISTGEGGMAVTNDDRLASRMRTMRLHGISHDAFDRYTAEKPAWYYEIVAPGFKYNLTDIAAAIGIHQLRKVRQFAARRRRIAERYANELAGLPLKLPATAEPKDDHAWHLFVIRLDLRRLDITRNRFIELLAEEGIGTSVHFIPLHIQPYWRDRYGFSPTDFPRALEAYESAVSLPIYPAMSDDDVGRVINAVRDILLAHGT